MPQFMQNDFAVSPPSLDCSKWGADTFNQQWWTTFNVIVITIFIVSALVPAGYLYTVRRRDRLPWRSLKAFALFLMILMGTVRVAYFAVDPYGFSRVFPLNVGQALFTIYFTLFFTLYSTILFMWLQLTTSSSSTFSVLSKLLQAPRSPSDSRAPTRSRQGSTSSDSSAVLQPIAPSFVPLHTPLRRLYLLLNALMYIFQILMSIARMNIKRNLGVFYAIYPVFYFIITCLLIAGYIVLANRFLKILTANFSHNRQAGVPDAQCPVHGEMAQHTLHSGGSNDAGDDAAVQPSPPQCTCMSTVSGNAAPAGVDIHHGISHLMGGVKSEAAVEMERKVTILSLVTSALVLLNCCMETVAVVAPTTAFRDPNAWLAYQLILRFLEVGTVMHILYVLVERSDEQMLPLALQKPTFKLAQSPLMLASHTPMYLPNVTPLTAVQSASQPSQSSVQLHRSPSNSSTLSSSMPSGQPRGIVSWLTSPLVSTIKRRKNRGVNAANNQNSGSSTAARVASSRRGRSRSNSNDSRVTAHSNLRGPLRDWFSRDKPMSLRSLQRSSVMASNIATLSSTPAPPLPVSSSSQSAKRSNRWPHISSRPSHDSSVPALHPVGSANTVSSTGAVVAAAAALEPANTCGGPERAHLKQRVRPVVDMNLVMAIAMSDGVVNRASTQAPHHQQQQQASSRFGADLTSPVPMSPGRVQLRPFADPAALAAPDSPSMIYSESVPSPVSARPVNLEHRDSVHDGWELEWQRAFHDNLRQQGATATKQS
ncbi:hypothetical protein RI367_004422 [Sorochytrium milnesiophthora]